MIGKTDYTTTSDLPDGYVCTDCGVTGCKLWRHLWYCDDLLCVDCVGLRRSVDVTGVDDHIEIEGWVPAIPLEEGSGYWSYGEVPRLAVRWWTRLPIRTVRPMEAAQ